MAVVFLAPPPLLYYALKPAEPRRKRALASSALHPPNDLNGPASPTRVFQSGPLPQWVAAVRASTSRRALPVGKVG